ncbi:MAG: prephenate dehydrogenase [Chloroflexota bacterium]
MAGQGTAAVLGLATLGASLALALRETGRFASVAGWDPNFDIARHAQKLSIADRYARRAPDAVEGAAVVFVSVGAGQMRGTLAAIGPHLRPGVLVCCLDEAQERASALASELLPASVSFVAAHSVLWEAPNPDAAPSPAIFRQGTLCLSPLPSAHPDAIAYLIDLAEALGLAPFFVGSREHDAFFSGVGRLPSVLAATLVRVVAREVSWRELSRMAGGEFRQATALVGADPSAEQQALAGSRDHLVRWLDAMVAELVALRQALQDGEEPADYFASAVEARRKWLRDRQAPPQAADLPEAPRPPKRGFWR